DGLISAGVRREDIIVFERYADEFIEVYKKLMDSSPMRGVRWAASAAAYSNEQVDIQGFDGGRDQWSPELARHVVGYDPDVYRHMGFCLTEHDKKDDRRFR